MYRLAQSLGVVVLLDSRVQTYDPETPSLTLDNGIVYTADLIIGADGKIPVPHHHFQIDELLGSVD